MRRLIRSLKAALQAFRNHWSAGKKQPRRTKAERMEAMASLCQRKPTTLQ